MLPSALRTAVFAFAVPLALGTAPEPARADMMAACSTEIAAHCGDVSRGRGRISACLFGQYAQLGGSCKPEVQAIAQSGARNPLVPRDVRRMMSADFRGNVPASCGDDIGRFCGGIAAGDARQFACLYARLDKVAPSCRTETEAALAAN